MCSLCVAAGRHELIKQTDRINYLCKNPRTRGRKVVNLVLVMEVSRGWHMEPYLKNEL